jgi:hypothetical protein
MLVCPKKSCYSIHGGTRSKTIPADCFLGKVTSGQLSWEPKNSSRMYHKMIHIQDFEYMILLLDWPGKQMLSPSFFLLQFQGFSLGILSPEYTHKHGKGYCIELYT